jgi:hypothetical protein
MGDAHLGTKGEIWHPALSRPPIMAPQTSLTQGRLMKLTTCFTAVLETLSILSDSFRTPFILPISFTTASMLKMIEVGHPLSSCLIKSICLFKAGKQISGESLLLMEEVCKVLYAIIALHVKSSPAEGLAPPMLGYLGEFTQ